MGLAYCRNFKSQSGEVYITPTRRRREFGMSDPDKTHLPGRFSEEEVIDIFCERTQVWQIDKARQILESDQSEFAFLFIICAYVEQIGHCLGGVGSTASIKRGFSDIFEYSEESDESRAFSTFVRNGLYHRGITEQRFAVGNRTERRAAIARYDANNFIIYPLDFLDSVQNHFDRFMQRVKTDENGIRHTFLNRMLEEAGAENCLFHRFG